MPIEPTELETHKGLGGRLERLVMREFTQGVCEDSAAILKDGKPLSIEEILAGLRLIAEWKAISDVLTAMPGNKQIERAFMLKTFEKKVADFLSI